MSKFKYTPEMIKFIVEAKSSGFSHREVTNEFNKVFNMNKSIKNIKDVFLSYKDISNEYLEDLAVKLEKNNFKLENQNKALKTQNQLFIKQEVKQESLTENLERLLKNNQVTVKPYKSKKRSAIKRELNLVLSDLHFGSDIRKDETGKATYGTVEESRRFASIIKETINYKQIHRNETSINVLLLGDILQNSLHDARDGAPLAEQSARAIYLINQGIAQLSANFPKVTVYCNTGNHGRNIGRHHGRATNQKWDSIETIIYFAVKESCKALKNVEFVIPKTPFVSYSVFNKKIFATHGDTVLNPGYPGKAIKTGVLENQINRINASLRDADEYSVFIVGHVHTASMTHLSNGAVMVTNGAIVPSDEYAISIGLMESCSGQYLFESVEDFPVGDSRFIKVDETQDVDASLDDIITPWENL